MTFRRSNSSQHQAQLIVAFFFAYAVAVLYIVISIFFYNYSHHDGNALPNGRVIGGDFISFYIAGQFVRDSPSELYNFSRQMNTQNHLLAELDEGRLPFIYPPLVAWMFATFTETTLIQAYFRWLVFSVIAFTIAILVLQNALKLSTKYQFLGLLICAGFQPFVMECLAAGQTSILGLLIFSFVFGLLKQRNDFSAGLVLSLSYYKPPLFIFAVLAFLFQQHWRVIGGFLVGAGILIAVTVLQVGFHGFIDYLSQAKLYTYGVELVDGQSLPVEQGVGLYALLSSGFHPHQSIAAMILVVLYLFGAYKMATFFPAIAQNRGLQFDIWFSLITAISLFLSVQMINYDLSILLVPFVVVAPQLLKRLDSAAGILGVVSIAGFYTEWIYRSKIIGSVTFHASVVFFILLIVSLIWTLRQFSNEKVITTEPVV